jgi:hypothetical protein
MLLSRGSSSHVLTQMATVHPYLCSLLFISLRERGKGEEKKGVKAEDTKELILVEFQRAPPRAQSFLC